MNSNSPKVTVLMPVYNGEKYIRDAIDSILRQTFRDFELIIIDDGSADNTAKILVSYDDPRIIIVNNEVNIGVAKSLNIGLKLAKGKYIARMDADDISLPTRLEKQADFLDKNTNIGLLGTSWISIDEDGNELYSSHAYSGSDAVHFMCHGSVMIRKEYLDRLGEPGYRPIVCYAEDYDLWLRLREIYSVANLEEPLYKLRIYKQSISVTKKLEQDLDALLALDMAEERRRYGRDRLQTATLEEAAKIRRQKQSLRGLKLRKALSKLRCTWAEAAFQLGERRKTYGYAKEAIRLYPFNITAAALLFRQKHILKRNV